MDIETLAIAKSYTNKVVEEIGTPSFSGLSDTNFTSLSDGDLAVYNATSTKWENKAVSAYRTFNVAVADWDQNSGATATDYPYIAVILDSHYSNNSRPVWQMKGSTDLPTSTERADINLVLEAIFSSSGITLYATACPSGALVLEVKGD